jgi:hypothetical protein
MRRALRLSGGLTILLISVACREEPPPRGATSGPAPPPGVTQNLVPRQGGIQIQIDLVGPISNPTGKAISAFASRPFPVAGWAVDTDNKQVAANVDVVIDGVPYAARYGISRKDVAAYLKDDAFEKSGFEFSMPSGALAVGSHTVVVRVVGRDAKSFVQSPELKVAIEH